MVLIFCFISPNLIALRPNYITVVEDGPIVSAKCYLPVTFGQNCPMQQSHSLSVTAKLLVLYQFYFRAHTYGWMSVLCWYFDLSHQLWSMLNIFRTEESRCSANLHKLQIFVVFHRWWAILWSLAHWPTWWWRPFAARFCWWQCSRLAIIAQSNCDSEILYWAALYENVS